MEARPNVIGGGSKEELRPGVWRIRHSLGRDPETGKYRYSPWRNVYTTRKSEVRAALEEYKRELNEKPLDESKTITVREYARKYHEMRAGSRLSPLSYKREGQEIDRICELFGDIAVSRLKPSTIKEVYARVRKEQTITENGLHHVHLRLRLILDDAVDDEILKKNPCKKISVPRPEPKEREPLSREEAARFLACLERERLDSRIVAAYLMLMTGMRRGEVLGLTWRRVSFDPPQIYVVQQYASDKSLRSPKSKKSKRHIGIEPDTVNHLAAWKAVQAHQLAELGIEQTPDTPVIERITESRKTERGKTISEADVAFSDPANFDRWFREFCVKHGFGHYENIAELYQVRISEGGKMARREMPVEEYRTLKESGARIEYVKTIKHCTGYTGLCAHALRHTHATLLISGGIDLKTVQARLGHAQFSTTLDIYSHAIAANDARAAAAFNGMITDRSVDEVTALTVSTEQLEDIPKGADEIMTIIENAGPRNGVEAVTAVREFALAQKGEFTKRQAMEACHINSQKWMSKALVSLQAEGVIEKIGTSKDARYRLCS